MKKYITTSKHPELKEGLILDHSIIENCAGDDLTDDYGTPAGWVRFDIHHIKEMLNRGYIKEVEEKEFTKSDMISYGNFDRRPEYKDMKQEDTFDKWWNSKYQK